MRCGLVFALVVGMASSGFGAGHYEGWVCGGGDVQGGLLLATTNGTDWFRQGVGQLPLVDLSAVCSSGTGNVWVVGDVEGEYAAIYHSPDRGASWSRQGDAASLPSNVLQKVCVVQTQVVWAVGVSGTVVRTVNGGTTWVDVSVPGWAEAFQGVAAVDGQTAWVSGDSNASGYCGLFKTIDGGSNWVRQTNGAVTNVNHLLGMAAVDADHVWGIGGHELIIYTENGGGLWQEAYQGGAGFKDGNEIYVRETNEVYAAFDSFVLWSRDNGTTWTNHSTADYTMDISSPKGTNIWAVEDGPYGCVIHYSPDGGETWEEQYTNSAYHFTTTIEMRWREDPPAILYVDAAGTNPVPPYASWETAAQTIQEAVDEAADGDWIWVTNGVYNTGTRVTPGFACLNRVVITNDITVQSVNGPEVTLIVGAADPFSGGTGTNAVRGVYMSAGRLNEFTITNGYTSSGGDGYHNSAGGGINLYEGTGVVSNCTIIGNSASFNGGGSEGGTFYNCRLIGNTAVNYGGGCDRTKLNNCILAGNEAKSSHGGGSYAGILNNCLLVDNSAIHGGGSSGGTLNNCLVINNHANSLGGGCFDSTLNNCTLAGNYSSNSGGSYYGTLNNCIVYSNAAGSNQNWQGSTFSYSCTTPLPSGDGNITNAPQFVNVEMGDCRLIYGSPCIDTGNDELVVGSTDLEGYPRILDGTVNMGAYEMTYSGVTVETSPEDAGTTTGSGGYLPGTNIVISADPADGHWFFTGWNDGETSSVRTIAIPSSNITYTAAFTQFVGLMTFYVAEDGNDTNSGLRWLNAKRTIQAGVDLTWDGDTVMVSNGMYTSGITTNHVGLSRVVITNDITVQSVNGPEVTTIAGAADPVSGGNGEDAVRCVYMSAGCLCGFTITNGHTLGGLYPYSFISLGGGVNASGGAGIVSNCLLVGNSAYSGGGGSFGIFHNCTFIGNSANHHGGGAESSSLNNCIISGNSAGVVGGGCSGSIIDNCILSSNHAGVSGGGITGGLLTNCKIISNSATTYGGGGIRATLDNCLLIDNSAGDRGGGGVECMLNNCTLFGNSASNYGGGGVDCTQNNCIVYFNTAVSDPNWYNSSFTNCCTTPLPPGDGNITNDPQFVDAAASDLHLWAISPCIDTGDNVLMPSDADLDGIPRPLDGDNNGSAIVDMGCCEYMNAAADSDGDTMTDGDETIADTNPTDAASYFHVTVISNLALMRMFFISSSNRFYTLQGTTNLVTGPWTNVPGQGPRMGAGGLDWMEQSNGLRMGAWRLSVGVP